MRQEIKWGIYLVSLGMSLVAYAHMTFATKGITELLYERLKVIDERVYEIHKITLEKK